MYLGQLFLKKGTIGYGCLVLLGSVSVAGVAELEIQHSVFSKWGSSIETWFSERIKSIQPSVTVGQPVTLQHMAFPFTYIWVQVYRQVSSAWPFVKSAFEMIKSSIKEIWDGIKNFFKSLADPEVFNNIFKDLHLKIWRVIVFILAGGEGRNRFANLFKKDKKETTQTAAKFLLGMEHKGSKYFKADKNVFSYLLFQWMFNPDRVTDKFDRLSKTIDRLINKAEQQGSRNGGSSGSEDSEGDKHTYVLKVPTVQQYLDVDEGLPEILFNLMWTGEVASKITLGEDYTVGSKSFISSLFKSSK